MGAPFRFTHQSSKSVTDVSAERVLRQVVVQKVNLITSVSALFHLISSSCCVGAFSSSSESSRRVSPGQAAGPGRPSPSSPVCGAAWMSSAHGEPAPSPPVTQINITVRAQRSLLKQNSLISSAVNRFNKKRFGCMSNNVPKKHHVFRVVLRVLVCWFTIKRPVHTLGEEQKTIFLTLTY